MTATATTSGAQIKSLVSLIEERQLALDLTDDQLAAAVGFERGGIMSLIRSGAIKFPLSKIPALAEVLEIDASDLLMTAMKEVAPDLLDLIERVWGPRDLTLEEGRLVQACRKLAAGRKVAPIVFMDSVIALVTV